MVFIPPPLNVPVLKAFLMADLSAEQLNQIHDDFERGSGAKFHHPSVNLFISNNPDYRGKAPAEIRRDQDARGNTDPFLLIDDQTLETNSLMYVDTFASEDQVEDGEAESTDVLWTIRTKIEHIPLMWENFDIANTDIVEALGGCDVDYPVPENFEQLEIYDTGVDIDEEMAEISPTWVAALPDEIEESTAMEHREKFAPDVPEKVVRLKKNVAAAHGLVSDWCIPVAPVRERAEGREYPEDCVELQVTFDQEDWPPYQRLEGSL